MQWVAPKRSVIHKEAICVCLCLPVAASCSEVQECGRLTMSQNSSVQNRLDSVVTRSPPPRFSNLAPLLKSLHWLPVRYSIIYKLCTLTYQVFTSKQPEYLHSLLCMARQLRSLNSDPRSVPRFKTTTGCTCRYASVAGPTLCNSFTDNVKSANTVMAF